MTGPKGASVQTRPYVTFKRSFKSHCFRRGGHHHYGPNFQSNPDPDDLGNEMESLTIRQSHRFMSLSSLSLWCYLTGVPKVPKSSVFSEGYGEVHEIQQTTHAGIPRKTTRDNCCRILVKAAVMQNHRISETRKTASDDPTILPQFLTEWP